MISRCRRIVRATLLSKPWQKCRWPLPVKSGAQCSILRCATPYNTVRPVWIAATEMNCPSRFCITNLDNWLRCTVAERQSLTSELSLSYARPVSDRWPLDVYVGKTSAIGQPTRPPQPFILLGSINWVESWSRMCATLLGLRHLVNAYEMNVLKHTMHCNSKKLIDHNQHSI